MSAQTTSPSACKGLPCPINGPRVRGNAVVPPPDSFAQQGRLFDSRQNLSIAANGSIAIDLGFQVNFGSGLTSTLNVFENGYVTVGGLQAGVTTLGGLGAAPSAVVGPAEPPTIAAFFADLFQTPGSQIIVQRGLADPYADGGDFSRADVRRAVQISWYGLSTDPDCTGDCSVFAGLLFTEQNATDSNVEFLYGADGAPATQAGLGSTAGFANGRQRVAFSGPYGPGIPNFLEFRDGALVNAPAVPEPATWAMMIAGFLAVGLALRRRRPRTVRPALV